MGLFRKKKQPVELTEDLIFEVAARGGKVIIKQGNGALVCLIEGGKRHYSQTALTGDNLYAPSVESIRADFIRCLKRWLADNPG